MEEHHRREDQNLEVNSDEIEELEKLEEDVECMAQKIAEFRETLPDQLKNTLSSIIIAQRPANLNRLDTNSDPGPPDNLKPDLDSEGGVKILVEKNQVLTEKVEMIKHKISDNASKMALLVKRMKDCMSRIDKLQPFKQHIIHPAFTRKRMT